jgi:hypothetical protein
LLTQLATLLEQRPELASPVEAFVDLLVRGERARGPQRPALPPPKREHLLPILATNELPMTLSPEDGGGRPPADLALFLEAHNEVRRTSLALAEPALVYPAEAGQIADLLTTVDAEGSERGAVLSPAVATCFPDAFGWQVPDDTMSPMFAAGDTIIVSPTAAAKIGRPALCHLTAAGGARCRIWLGEDGTTVNCGRLADGETERLERATLGWSLEVLYRLARAA